MEIKRLVLFILLIMLAGCGQTQSEEREKESEKGAVTVLSQENAYLSFSWIEKGYNGVFVPVNQKLGQTEREIKEVVGKPVSEGKYEGGFFLQYENVTYFINPKTKRNVAIALDINSKKLTEVDLKRTLGTPDQSEFNEMDGLWMYVYELDEYELMFEAPAEHAVLSHAWLREKIK